MKKVVYFINAIFLFSFSCSNEPESEKILSVSEKNVEFTSEGGEKEISITANINWDVSFGADWLEVEATEKTGNGSIIIRVKPNDESIERTANVVITTSVAAVNEEIVITQEAEKDEGGVVLFERVIGTIIGNYSYFCLGSYIVQVDEEYPIGRIFEHVYWACSPSLPKEGIYRNLIQVQLFLPLSGWPESYLDELPWPGFEPMINKKISFSCREFRRAEEGEEGDHHLFTLYGNCVLPAYCTFPDVPRFIITECQILE